MIPDRPDPTAIKRKSKGSQGFTLFEMIIVIGLILFLTRLTFFQFTTPPHEMKLEGAAKSLGFYFNSASQTASATENWVLVIANLDPDTEGYLRQFGTYTWFRGNEPFDDKDGDGVYKDGEDYLDINGNESYDDMVTGWKVEDTKGHWLPDKIYLDVDRSGAAAFSGKGFSPVWEFSSPKKFHYFAVEDETSVGLDPNKAIAVARLPYFLDRSGYRDSNNQSGGYGSTSTTTGQTSAGELVVYEHELGVTKAKKPEKWIFFLFDPHGKYINIESSKLRGSVNFDAQRDFIVLGMGVLNFQGNPSEKHVIRPLSGKTETMLSAFVMHRTGNYSMIEDESQIPKP